MVRRGSRTCLSLRLEEEDSSARDSIHHLLWSFDLTLVHLEFLHLVRRRRAWLLAFGDPATLMRPLDHLTAKRRSCSRHASGKALNSKLERRLPTSNSLDDDASKMPLERLRLLRMLSEVDLSKLEEVRIFSKSTQEVAQILEVRVLL